MRYIVFLSICASWVFSQSTVWEGKIGDKTTYLHVDYPPITTGGEKHKACGGSYYFQMDTLLDKYLKKCYWVDENKIVLEGQVNSQETQLNLVKNTNRLNGYFVQGEKKTPVFFKQLEEKTFDTIKTPLLKYKPIESEHLVREGMILDISWVKEQYSKLVYPKITSGMTIENRKKINAVLRHAHTQKALEILSCSSQQSAESAQETMVSIGYISSTIFSLHFIDMRYCENSEYSGGTKIYGKMYDIPTAKVYSLDQLLAFSNGTPVYNVHNKKEWKAYRKQIFAPKMRDLIFELHHWTMEDDDKECVYGDTKYWEDVTWFLGKKGLEIKPNYEGDLVGCRDNYRFILPVEVLEKYKNTKYPNVLSEYMEYLKKSKKGKE